jgi:hypothetical protein
MLNNIMKKLWIFGDSYVSPWPEVPDAWTSCLPNALSVNQYKNFGLAGASNEWSYKHFKDQIPYITEGDYVIFVGTNFSRKWFFKDLPSISSMPAIDIAFSKQDKNITTNMKDAAYYFYGYLENVEVAHDQFALFLCLLHLMKEKLKLKVLILPGFPETTNKFNLYKSFFPSFNTVNGNLMTVHHKEYEQTFFDRIQIISDYKPNHLTVTNHKILLEKVIDAFDSNHIDLNTGFNEQIINDTNYKDTEFIKKELLTNKIMEFKYR